VIFNFDSKDLMIRQTWAIAVALILLAIQAHCARTHTESRVSRWVVPNLPQGVTIQSATPRFWSNSSTGETDPRYGALEGKIPVIGLFGRVIVEDMLAGRPVIATGSRAARSDAEERFRLDRILQEWSDCIEEIIGLRSLCV
jgi:hypothetical protein